MNNIIEELEKKHLNDDIPNFRSGDTVELQIKVQEGTRSRIQTFVGVVIGRKNRSLNSSFTVRLLKSVHTFSLCGSTIFI